MSDAADTLRALQERIRRIRQDAAKPGPSAPFARVYTITDRRYVAEPWPPSEAETKASAEAVTRHCAEGCGDIADALPPCPHEREALDDHRGPANRADFGDYHHTEPNP